MKKSHRKDVIIARIIFAFIVVILVALIVFGIKAIMKYRAGKETPIGTESQTTETVSTETAPTELPSEDDNSEWIVDDTETENTEQPQETQTTEEEPEPATVTLKAMYGVNIRAGAGTDNDILGSVPEGDTATLLEERDDGWGYIQYGDLTGYVYLEYFLILDPAE